MNTLGTGPNMRALDNGSLGNANMTAYNSGSLGGLNMQAFNNGVFGNLDMSAYRSGSLGACAGPCGCQGCGDADGGASTTTMVALGIAVLVGLYFVTEKKLLA